MPCDPHLYQPEGCWYRFDIHIEIPHHILQSLGIYVLNLPGENIHALCKAPACMLSHLLKQPRSRRSLDISALHSAGNRMLLLSAYLQLSIWSDEQYMGWSFIAKAALTAVPECQETRVD